MAIRQIIDIIKERCNGCGLCAEACHEGAIGIVDGKATLLRDDYCDGLGDCLPACPTNAIRFIQREAADYDEAAVIAAKEARESVAKPAAQSAAAQPQAHAHHHGGGCPGSAARTFTRTEQPAAASVVASPAPAADAPLGTIPVAVPNEISTWPIQIKLVNPMAGYFNGCDLLVAADCTAFAYGNFHHDFMRGKVCVIGCPKLDMVDYTDKLTNILAVNDVKSVTMARMVVPCCGGLEQATRAAVASCGKDVPLRVVTFDLDGTCLG